MTDFTKREALLIELVHLLSYGSMDELGMTLEEVMNILNSRVRSKDNATILELLDLEGRKTIEDIKKAIEESEKF